MLTNFRYEALFTFHNAPHWYENLSEYLAMEPLRYRTAKQRKKLISLFLRGKRALGAGVRKKPMSIGEYA